MAGLSVENGDTSLFDFESTASRQYLLARGYLINNEDYYYYYYYGIEEGIIIMELKSCIRRPWTTINFW